MNKQSMLILGVVEPILLLVITWVNCLPRPLGQLC